MTNEKNSYKDMVVLAVGAHPDDMDFGASGTIARMVEEGATAYYVICTDGSRGSEDPKMTHEKLATIRREEQLAAAKVLGIKEVFFLEHTDTQLVADTLLKEELVRIIRTVRPTIAITMDPTFYYAQEFSLFGASFVNHNDHRMAALATMDAVFPMARDRLTFLTHEQEGLKPHAVKELWFTSLEKSEYIFDISSVFDKKVKALSHHKSQFPDWKKTFQRVTDRAEKFGAKEGFQYGESFVRLIMP